MRGCDAFDKGAEPAWQAMLVRVHRQVAFDWDLLSPLPGGEGTKAEPPCTARLKREQMRYNVHASSLSRVAQDGSNDALWRRKPNVITPAIVEMIPMAAAFLTGISPPGGSLRL